MTKSVFSVSSLSSLSRAKSQSFLVPPSGGTQSICRSLGMPLVILLLVIRSLLYLSPFIYGPSLLLRTALSCRYTISFRCRLSSTNITSSSSPIITSQIDSGRSWWTASCGGWRQVGCWMKTRRGQSSEEASSVTPLLLVIESSLECPSGIMSTSVGRNLPFSSISCSSRTIMKR